MEAEEEHDGLFDAPVPFGSAEARDLIQTGAGKSVSKTTEMSVSCDADDGMDHFIYTDPEEDKAVW